MVKPGVESGRSAALPRAEVREGMPRGAPNRSTPPSWRRPWPRARGRHVRPPCGGPRPAPPPGSSLRRARERGDLPRLLGGNMTHRLPVAVVCLLALVACGNPKDAAGWARRAASRSRTDEKLEALGQV